jgi:hypothetical protein
MAMARTEWRPLATGSILIPERYQAEVGMTFIVAGLSETGPALIGCDSEVEALEKAAELIRAGFVEVLIADGQASSTRPVTLCVCSAYSCRPTRWPR